MDEGLLALFEGIKQDFLTLPLDDFTNKAQNESHKLDIWPAVTATPLESDWKSYWECKEHCYKYRLSSLAARKCL